MTIERSQTQATQATKEGVSRYVLGISLVLVIVVFVITYSFIF